MANTITGNKIYIDSTGTAKGGGPIKVAHIFFTPAAANDQLVIRETASGSDCLIFQSSTAKTTMHFDCSVRPLVFQNGIYIQTLTSGAKATLVTTQAGD